MPGIRYVFTIEAGTSTAVQALTKHQDRAKTCQSIINLFTGIDAGDWRAGRVEVQQGAGIPNGGGVAASQTVTYSGSSGAQTVVIGGRTVNFTAGATDAATVQNAIAAIQADAIASGLVFIPTPPNYGATINTLAILTLWANTIPCANQLGNGLTLTATGTGSTAGGATFTGGVNSARNGFNL